MSQIFLLLWRLCTFRAGPDAMPANNTLLGLIISLNALLSVSLYLLVNTATLLKAATLVSVSMAGTAGLVWLIMNLMEMGNRFPQTLMALFGVDILITLLTGAVAMVTGTEEISAAGASLLTLLMFWNLAIFAFIFHRALNIHIGFGFLLALFVVIFSIAMSQAAVST